MHIYVIYMLGIGIVAVCNVMMTRATGEMSRAAVGMDTASLVHFLGFLTAVMGVKAVFSAISVLLLERYAGRTEYKFRNNFIKHFLQVPFCDFEKKKSGALLSVYSTDLPDAAKYATTECMRLFSDIVTLLATVVYMLFINPLHTIAFYAMFPPLAAMQSLISKPITKLAVERSVERANFNTIVNDSLSNIPTIVAYSLEDFMEERYMTAYDRFFAVVKRYIRSSLWLTISGIVATVIPLVVIIGMTGMNVINGTMTLAEFIVFTTLAASSNGWLSMLSQRLQGVRTTAGGAARLIGNIDEPTEEIDVGDAVVEFSAAAEAIKFENVSFSYGSEGSSLALDNASFEIKKGSKTAIVGSSGSGKSTVMKLLLGLYTLQSGKITVSGQDVEALSKSGLRGHFAYVPQDSFMFPESISSNITCANQVAPETRERLERACADAGMLDFVKSLPEGFSTVLSEGGENVSGGQRQRIAIARAFYKNAPVILFDEATSSLDTVTEDAVLETLSSLKGSQTLVMITHRIRAARICDMIIVMESGKVAGIGRHNELLVHCPAYKVLQQAQSEPEMSDMQ